MKKKSTSQSAFFNLRVLIGLFTVLAGVFLALVGFGAFSVQAQQKPTLTQSTIYQVLPPGFDCSPIRALCLDRQDNLRAGSILLACGGDVTGRSFARWAATGKITSGPDPSGLPAARHREVQLPFSTPSPTLSNK